MCLSKLTQRETDVYRLVLQGYKSKEIAQKLGVSVKTISVHISSIFSKFDVRNRIELALKAHSLNGFEVPNIFIGGTKAKAVEVNENFNYLCKICENLQNQILELKAAVLVNNCFDDQTFGKSILNAAKTFVNKLFKH